MIRIRNGVRWGAALALLACGSAWAAPGTLANSPLFLTTSAEPNILFLLDDSGSMDWEVMTKDYAHGGIFLTNQPDGTDVADAGDIQQRIAADSGSGDCTQGYQDGGYIYGVEFGSNSTKDDAHDCYTADDRAWRFRDYQFNSLYFNPNKDYEPWAGTNVADVPFSEITKYTLTSAPDDPYNPTEYIDLTLDTSNWKGEATRDDTIGKGFYFYTWTDADGDGHFDNGEQTEYRIATLTDTDASQWGKTADEVKKNFANWFIYYRSRDYVAKAAYGHVIADATNVRIGLVTTSEDGDTAISHMNDDPTTGAKRDLLHALYSIKPSGDTPLHKMLYACGSYLACDSGGTLFGGACPEADVGAQCQQNFTVALSDGYYTDSDFNDASSYPDIANNDGDDNTAWDSGTNGPYGDAHDNTLADIAMHFYETDLRGNIANEVPTSPGVDLNHAQHMVTYTLGFGVEGTTGPTNDTDAFDWPDPSVSDENKIIDLRHAAFNGRGKYMDASDADALATALTDAITDIADRTGAAASVAFNSGKLSTDSVLYLALFNSNKWSGQLLAYALDGITGDIASSYDWDAAEVLDSMSPDSRTILTYNGTDGTPFRWNSLTTAQQDDLKTDHDGNVSTDPTIGQARLAYLRGDRTDEGTGNNFRVRGSRLGDLIHSNPVYVGKPEMNWPNTSPFPVADNERYADFVLGSAGSRTAMIYVGSNDGMLHGFRASDGQEMMAYVPGNLFSSGTSDAGLHYLTDPDYLHHYYVDLSPTVADAYMNTEPSVIGSTDEWHTILIGGERAGGKGYFALDVTDPSVFSEANAAQTVLWEFSSDPTGTTESKDVDLGYTFANPTVTLLDNGRWAAIFGNGYNSKNGEAKLFIVYLDGGLDGTWTYGRTSDYFALPTGVGDSSDPNGLGTPAVVDTDGNGTGDRVYVGDLKGNMWAFDLKGSDESKWDSAYLQGSTPLPLFTATAPDNTAQPITSEPVIVKTPGVSDTASPSNAPNVLVLFGTGQYMATGDNTTTGTQSFYGVWDDGTKELDRNSLVQQTLETGYPSDVRVMSDESVAYGTNHGWFFDLPATGERSVARAMVRGDYVYYNTLIPSTDVCSYGGSGWLMAVKTQNGGNPENAIFDYNNDGIFDTSDLVTDGSGNSAAPSGQKFTQGIPAESGFLGNKQYTPGSKTQSGQDVDARNIERLSSDKTGRTSWQELVND